MHVLRHDGDPSCMNGTEIGVLEKSNEERFTGFLQGHDSSRLESQVRLEVLSELTNETLERELRSRKKV